jgi:hypothetical protein
MRTPRVSIVVLTFNSARYIARCLNSLRAQTLTDFEVLVVDAGSRDQTKAIVACYDARFKWLELPGSDMGMARNFGAQHATGEYLCFLDSDDLYLPGKLEAQVAALDGDVALEVHFCRAYHFRTGASDRLGAPAASDRRLDARWFLAGNNENLNTLCMRRRTWEAGHRFGEGDRGRYGEEWRHQLAMSLAGVRMQSDPRPLVVVELRPDSHTVWDRQWVMKEQAISEVRTVAAPWDARRRRELGVEEAMDSFRQKHVVALLLAGRNAEARAAATAIRAGAVRWLLYAAGVGAGLLPRGWVRTGIQRLWLWRQERLFVWTGTPAEVHSMLADVAPPVAG